MALSGKGRREKGARGEREFFAALSEYLGEEVRRAIGASRDGGADSEAAGMLAPWAVEVKSQATPSVGVWWAQAVRQGEGRIPVLAYRLPHRPLHDRWRVRVPLYAVCDAVGRDVWTEDLEYTAEVGIIAFAAIVREMAHE